MKHLIRYYIKVLTKSNKWIAPAVLWIIFLYVDNSTAPAHYTANLCSSSGVLYFLMIWVGFSYMELENEVSDQLLLLKVNHVLKFNLSKILVLLILGTCMSTLGVFVPVSQHIINGGHLFTRSITFEDVIYSFMLLNFMAFLGSMLGAIAHPRILKDRKSAILLIFSIGMVGFIKGALIEDFPLFRIILWAFPPVYDILYTFSNQEYFSLRTIGIAAALSLVYSLILLLIYLHELKKRKF